MTKRPAWNFRDVLTAAATTQPASNVRKLPLDMLANQARNATPRVVDAQCLLDRLERGYKDAIKENDAYRAKLKEEFEAKIDEARIALQTAENDRRKAQFQFLREAIDSDVFVGVRDLKELAGMKEIEA